MTATTFDRSRLTRIDDWMRSYVDRGRYPGSTFLLAEGGKTVHRATCGMRDVAAKAPFEEDTIVRIYSMTKPITSVALMMLAERGLFHLDAPLSDFIPEFAECRALIDGAATAEQTEACPCPTLHQLATHTSGMTYAFNPGPAGEAYAAAGVDFKADGGGLEAATKRLAELPLIFTPGSRWNYSVGIDVLGRVIEVVAGKPLDEFFREEIFEPLGMADTFFRLPDDRLDQFAELYSSLDGDPMSLGRRGSGTLKLIDSAKTSAWRRTETFSGGGGLLSTIDDYFKFTEMLRRGGSCDGGRLLSASTLAFMRRNHLPGDIASMGPQSFAELPMTGMGFGIGGSVILDPALVRSPGNVGDFSWGGMASTIFWLDPVADLTAIFLTQVTPSSSYPSRPELKALVHGAMA